jgi:FkbM family methyltransferase
MNFAKDLIKKTSRRLLFFSRTMEYLNTDKQVFQYRDCFETIDVLIKLIKPQYLCDIGSNTGKWAYTLHQLNPELKHVVFFEPQSKLQEQLHSLSLPGVSKVIYPYGLGDKREKLFIKGGTPSASFLEATKLQSDYYPNSIIDENEEVEIKILDEVYYQNSLPMPDVIKIDVQGFELKVLQGAIQVLSQAKYLVVELSFCQFYQDQPHLWELLKFLQQNHYEMVNRGYEWRKNYSDSGQLLQIDGIFMNTAIMG